jgi:guanine nucleotide-binding protein alpha-1 subunit
VPTDDVLKARLKTLGVVEHKFTIRDGSHRGIDWKIFDGMSKSAAGTRKAGLISLNLVGGARNQRQAWAPYFEDGDI